MLETLLNISLADLRGRPISRSNLKNILCSFRERNAPNNRWVLPTTGLAPPSGKSWIWCQYVYILWKNVVIQLRDESGKVLRNKDLKCMIIKTEIVQVIVPSATCF